MKTKLTNIRVKVGHDTASAESGSLDCREGFETLGAAKTWAKYAVTDAYADRTELSRPFDNNVAQVWADDQDGRSYCEFEAMRKGWSEPEPQEEEDIPRDYNDADGVQTMRDFA